MIESSDFDVKTTVYLSLAFNQEKQMYQLPVLLCLFASTLAQPKCDQTPRNVAYDEPSENKGVFVMTLTTKGSDSNTETYRPDQTYVLTLQSTNPTNRTFRWFMITAEDPSVDNIDYQGSPADVGILKSLDSVSRYSERCMNTVENTDNRDKTYVEVHWVSPKPNSESEKVRIRATIGENDESWYAGPELTIILTKDIQRSRDSPPTEPRQYCNLCGEAQYQVIFQGRWSRLTHPQHYPSKPDENGYSHMIGASHALDYTLWKNGAPATPGVQQVAERSNITELERDIINHMALDGGTRTLIRGKRRHHPHMSEPSQSFLRVDKTHHLFSLIVALRPSPDWFLGVSMFELCKEDEWMPEYEMPLYPWDAGTMDGISYESQTSMTQPKNNIERVAVGSFDRESPFFQLNLNDLQPFATLTIKRLNVFPYTDCQYEEAASEERENNNQETPLEPRVLEAKAPVELVQVCLDSMDEWSNWSPCVPYTGNCGPGVQHRSRYDSKNAYNDNNNSNNEGCPRDEDAKLTQTQGCYANCT